MRFLKFLAFQKYLIKSSILRFIRINKLRIAGVEILSGAYIAPKVNVFLDNKIGHHSRLSDHVQLSPGVSIGNYSSLNNIRIGDNSIIESYVLCTGHGNGQIIIGKESYIGISNILDSSNNITIGDFVHIAGPSTGLWTHTSAPMCLNGIPVKDKGEEYRPTAAIKIENNVYIGGNCTIYPGITIGHHSVVAPNSAVTKDVPPFTMVGGVPAAFIKEIKL